MVSTSHVLNAKERSAMITASMNSKFGNVGQGRPVITYESGDEDDDDLVENIDVDFSVRSPWMTEVLDGTKSGSNNVK